MIAFREIRPTTERLYWQTTQALEEVELKALMLNGWRYLDHFNHAALVQIEGEPVIHVDLEMPSRVLVLERPWRLS